eukprot:643114-Rhodomonas_salina.1
MTPLSALMKTSKSTATANAARPRAPRPLPPRAGCQCPFAPPKRHPRPLADPKSHLNLGGGRRHRRRRAQEGIQPNSGARQ